MSDATTILSQVVFRGPGTRLQPWGGTQQLLLLLREEPSSPQVGMPLLSKLSRHVRSV